jgi:hypothetical protein
MNIRQASEQGEDEEQRLWRGFTQAADGSAFLDSWLALLMRQLGPAELAVLLLRQRDGAFAPAALWAPGGLERDRDRVDASPLATVAEQAIQKCRGVVRPAGEGAEIAFPIEIEGVLEGVVAVALARHPGAGLGSLFRRIHWASGWLQAASLRTSKSSAELRLARAAGVLQALAALEEAPTLPGALAGFCNELAARFGADRVSLGLRPGLAGKGRARLAAMSNAAWFQRRSALVRAIETAQAETLHQNDAVQVPPLPGARRGIDAAHRRLAAAHGANALISLHLRSEGKVVGVVTVERFGRAAADLDTGGTADTMGENPGFDAEAVESLTLAVALAGPVIGLKRRNHRWFGGRLRDGIADGLGKLLGPRRPALKLAALGLIALAAWLGLAEGEFRSSAKATIEGAVQRAVVAPFQGFVAEAPVRAGERVEPGQLLARLDDRDLRFERLKWDSERLKSEQRQREALAKGDRAGVLVAAAQIAQAQAELALVDEKLTRTRLTAPLAGLVVSGDLSQMLGAPVEQGKVLFEIAPLDDIRVVLQVPEGDYRFVAERFAADGPGLRGVLVLTGETERSLPIRISAVTPVSTAQDGRNSFRVEAALIGATAGAGLRPGMEGVGKIELGRGRLIWVWSRTTLDRLRLMLWTWLP